MRVVGDEAMETRRVFLVLADISGYTRFARLHRLSQAHAESIICELLDAVIAHTEHPLKLNELLGDAAFFYAPSDRTPATAQPVFASLSAAFCFAATLVPLGSTPLESSCRASAAAFLAAARVSAGQEPSVNFVGTPSCR